MRCAAAQIVSGRGALTAWTPERQLRLTAPIFKPTIETHNLCGGRCRVSKTPRARGSTKEEEGNRKAGGRASRDAVPLFTIAGEPGGKAAAS